MSDATTSMQRPGLMEPLPAFSKLALSIRLAIYGRNDPRVQYMAERNQMLKHMREHGFAAPVASA
jgi:hypothetical protein